MQQNGGLNLKHLMNNDEYVDNTNRIRELKHSEDILLDVGKICKIKNEANYKSKTKEELEELRNQCSSEANFLFCHYTDIFHKVFNDELDLKMLVDFVKILKRIEESDLDQFNGSVMVGKILHDMYVSSAEVRSKRIDAEMAATAAASTHLSENETGEMSSSTAAAAAVYDKTISWKQFKAQPVSSSQSVSDTPATTSDDTIFYNRSTEDGKTFNHYHEFKYHRLN